MKKLTVDTWISGVSEIIKKYEDEIAYGIVDKKIVLVCTDNQVDKTICKELGYSILKGEQYGGTLVLNKGDFEILHFAKPNTFLEDFINVFIKWLNEKGINAEFKGNDVMAEGYKILGCSRKPYGAKVYTAIHIALNVNLENIKKICTKPMNKVPKGLNDFGITSKEIEDFFINYCEEK